MFNIESLQIKFTFIFEWKEYIQMVSDLGFVLKLYDAVKAIFIKQKLYFEFGSLPGLVVSNTIHFSISLTPIPLAGALGWPCDYKSTVKCSTGQYIARLCCLVD